MTFGNQPKVLGDVTIAPLDMTDKPSDEGLRRGCRQFVVAAAELLTQFLEILDHPVMLGNMPLVLRIVIQPHQQLLGHEVRSGELVDLFQDPRRLDGITTFSDRFPKSLQQGYLEAVFPVHGTTVLVRPVARQAFLHPNLSSRLTVLCSW
jgi:hypothetical protein